MTEKEEYEKIREMLNKFMGKFQEIINKDSFRCSMYLLEYLETKDRTAWDKFIELFSDLNHHDKLQVFVNVNANLKEREEKEKVKKKGNDKYE